MKSYFFRPWAEQIKSGPPLRCIGRGAFSGVIKSSDQLVLPPKQLFEALRLTSTQPKDVQEVFRRYSANDSKVLSFSDLHSFAADVRQGQCSEEEVDRIVRDLLQRYAKSPKVNQLALEEFTLLLQDHAAHVDKRVYALAGTIGVSFAAFSMVFPMGPELIQVFGLSHFQFGTLTTAFALSKLCSNIPSGMLCERMGRKPVLAGGLLMVGVGLSGIGAASCYEHLLALRLCMGMGIASTFTAAGMYISDISHPLNSARTRAPMSMGMSVGMLGGPAFGGVLLEQIGLPATAYSIGAATVVTASLALAVLPETSAALTCGTVPSQGAAQPLGFRDTLRSWQPMLANPEIRSILSWGWFYNVAFWGGISLLPLIYVDLALTPSTVGAISTFTAGCNLVVTPVAASLADKHGKLRAVMPGAAIYGTGLLMIPSVGSLSELLPVLGVMQVGAALCAQGQMHAMDCAAGPNRARVPGLWNTIGDTGMLVSSFGSAALAQATSTGSALAIDGAMLLVATGLIAGAAGWHRR